MGSRLLVPSAALLAASLSGLKELLKARARGPGLGLHPWQLPAGCKASERLRCGRVRLSNGACQDEDDAGEDDPAPGAGKEAVETRFALASCEGACGCGLVSGRMHSKAPLRFPTPGRRWLRGLLF